MVAADPLDAAVGTQGPKGTAPVAAAVLPRTAPAATRSAVQLPADLLGTGEDFQAPRVLAPGVQRHGDTHEFPNEL